MLQNDRGKQLDSCVYNPEYIYCIDGNTALHEFAHDYKALELLINHDEKTSPYLINLILLKN